MSGFGPDARDVFRRLYDDVPPWDVGDAQPALTALFDAHPPVGPVLDAGCGSGDLALALARRGHEVVGVDYVESAIMQARAKAAAAPPEVAARLRFVVADATRPSALGRFGAVVDSGFFHVLDDLQRAAFVDELARALAPGGRFYLLAFATDFGIPNTPRRVTADEVRARFGAADGWRVVALHDARFENRIAPVPATAACIERHAGLQPDSR